MIHKLRRLFAPTRRRVRWDRRFRRQLAGWTDDQGAAAGLRSLLYEAGVTLKAGNARWRPDEVIIVGQVIGNIAQAFGEPVSRIVGGVTIKRTHTSKWPLGFAWARCYGWQGLGIVRLNDSAFAAPHRAEHVLTHELGHYFQESRVMLRAYMRATGGHQFNWFGLALFNLSPYRCEEDPPNQWCLDNGVYEDFAGSFETFVYAQIGKPLAGHVLGPRRAQFFGSCESLRA